MKVLITRDDGRKATLLATFDDPEDADVAITGEAGRWLRLFLADGARLGHAHYSPVRGITVVNRRSVNWILAELDRARRFNEGVAKVVVVDATDMPTYELPEGAVG